MDDKEIKEQQMSMELEFEVRMERMVERKLMDVAMKNYLLNLNAQHPLNNLPFQLHPMNLNHHHPVNNLPFQLHPTNLNSSNQQQLLQTTPSSNIIMMKRKTQSYQDKGSLIKKCFQKKNKNPYCSLCQVSATNEGCFKLHLQGKKHLSKLHNSNSTNAVDKSSQLKGFVSVPEQHKTSVSKKWHCSLCQISVTSETLLKSHVEGKKHKSKEAKHGVWQNSDEMVSLDQISQGVEERGHINVKKNLNHQLQGKTDKANKGITNGEIRDGNTNLSNKVERKREEVLKKNEGSMDTSPQLKQQEEIGQKWIEEEFREQEKVNGEMRKCVKYWYCEMCDEGTYEVETMASHRRSDKHMRLLFQKGGNVIVVSRIHKE